LKHSDEKTESQKIEKLLERTLNEHFDRLLQVMNQRERKLSGAGLMPDAKYSPSMQVPKPNYAKKISPIDPKKTKPPAVQISPIDPKKTKPPAVPYDLKPN
jgi:hypothetical protein